MGTSVQLVRVVPGAPGAAADEVLEKVAQDLIGVKVIIRAVDRDDYYCQGH